MAWSGEEVGQGHWLPGLPGTVLSWSRDHRSCGFPNVCEGMFPGDFLFQLVFLLEENVCQTCIFLDVCVKYEVLITTAFRDICV